MKANKTFRNLTPLTIESKGALTVMRRLAASLDCFNENDERFAQWIAHEPTGSQWETVGLCQAFGTEYVRDIQGSGLLMFLRFYKRMLPARVINEEVERMAEEIESVTGRKPGRKEKRSLRDDAETKLLPRAFVNSTVVPVIISSTGDLFVFSTSSGKVDATVSFLMKFLMDWGIEVVINHPSTKVSLPTYMTSIAINAERDDDVFRATEFIVMRGEEQACIRVQGYDTGNDEVQTAIMRGFRVDQIGLVHVESAISFRLDDKFSLRQVTLSNDMLLGVNENTDDEVQAFDGIVWLVITEYRKLLDDLMRDIGKTPSSDDDDEEL